MKIKLIVGFRRDQEHTIDADEVHKAYYLFLNPEARSIFKNGLAIKGDQIQEIVADYQGTMGWNATHVLDNDDWNDIRNKKIDITLRNLMSTGKQIAELCTAADLNTPLTELLQNSKYAALGAERKHIGGLARIGEFMPRKL